MSKQPPTTRCIAFLRGINVGGHRVKMESLRELFEGLKLQNVSTFIASGNVVFDAPSNEDAAELEQRIEKKLRTALSYEVPTFLRTPEELAAIVAFRPFPTAELDAAGHTLHVCFLRQPPTQAAGRLLASMQTKMDEFRVRGRELYWLCRGKTTDSLVQWRVVDKSLAAPSTMRNIKMLRKLAALHPPQCSHHAPRL